MSRTKGAIGRKHKKVKPVKEKKKRGRPSKQHQQQHQIVNVNVGGGGGGGGGNKTIPIPFQLPSTIYDPSLITPNYGINDRQPTNPLTDSTTDFMTPFLQAMISNQKQNQQQAISNQPKQPQPQPVIITQPTQPQPQPTQPQRENPQIIIPPKPEKPGFTHEDVQKLIDQIHHKQEKEIPEPIPQNTPPKPHKQMFYDTFGIPINANLGQTINDKYDGLKMKNKTMLWSDVASGTFTGITGGIATG
jgi:hypothetical protein